jgi:hydroxypyruvate reductase
MSDDTDSLAEARKLIETLFAAGLAAVDPERAVASAIAVHGGWLLVDGESVPLGSGIYLVAVGKAAPAMALGAVSALGNTIVAGNVITKEGHASGALPERIQEFEAGHPIPDRRGVEAASAALRNLNALPDGAVVLALISGGGSALLESPREGISLEDLATITDALLRAGAPIDALNAVRSPLSRVKMGGLRSAAPNALWVTLILSDVLGNDPRVIASGPTIVAHAERARALQTIDRYGVRDMVPPAAIALLSEPEAMSQSDLGSGDILRIIGDNGLAMRATAAAATDRGMRSEIVWQEKQGEASERGREFVRLLEAVSADIDFLVGGGEMTVTVRGAGQGGRNTEFALAAALELETQGLSEWVVASLGTDGQDATTGYAGAIADARTAARSREHGVDPARALRDNDSLRVFEVAGGAVFTGPTGTNVNDLYLALRRRAH